MKHEDAKVLLDAIRKNKYYIPTEWERKFLEDLSFYVELSSIKVSEKQSKTLQEIYRKASAKL